MALFPTAPHLLARPLVRTVLFLLAASPLSGSVALAGDFAGPWKGAIEIPGSPLGVHVDLKGGGESLGGTIDIPAQGARGLHLGEFVVDGSKIRFSISGIPGTPTFDGTLEGESIQGQFHQGGQTFPFRLSRAEPAAPPEPPPPVPYDEEEVGYESGSIHLAGTLTLPRGEGPFPAVLLLTGSGPQDRDHTLFGHRPFQLIADHLTRAGIAVLRVDDRGVGGSSGQVMESTLTDFADDALAGVAFLKSRSEIDTKRIGLLGHSEGGIVAPLAASRSQDVAFLILLAAPTVPGDELLYRQNELLLSALGAEDKRIEEQLARLREIFGLLRAEGDQDKALREAVERQIAWQLESAGMDVGPDALQGQAQAALGMYTSPWFQSFLTFDPGPILRQTQIPLLALNGGLDLQVGAEQNLTALRNALEAAGNGDAVVKELSGLNHLFQKAQTGLPTEYGQIEEAMDEEVLDLLRDWIVDLRGRRATKPVQGT